MTVGHRTVCQFGGLIACCLLVGACRAPSPAGGPAHAPIVLDDFESLDGWTVWSEAWGGKAEFAKAGSAAVGAGAIRFTGPGIIYRELPRGTGIPACVSAPPDTGTNARATEEAQGISFWVRGDGSLLHGTIVVGPAGAGSWQQGFVHAGMTGHAFYFPLADTNWHRITAPWADFIPEGPHPAIGTEGGLRPGDIRVLRIGNRWKYWRNYDAYPRFSYEIDQVELVYDARDTSTASPRGTGTPACVPTPPDTGTIAHATTAQDVIDKMRRGKPVRILCVGDSITAGAGTTPDRRYWRLVEPRLREAFRNEGISVEGWGIGGATLLDALPWIEWILGPEPPDLVTLMFGTNDCSTYDETFFRWCLSQFIDRTARASRGRTAVLPFATLPGRGDYFTKTDRYAEQVRLVCAERHLPFLDLSASFKGLGEEAMGPLFGDGVHLNTNGHEFVAGALCEFLQEPRQEKWQRE